jgi:predicted Zn-dependent protease with MMP-like domain
MAAMAVKSCCDSIAGLVAPSLDDLTLLADEALRSLPAEFRGLCRDVVIRVEDFPDEEVLDDLDCESDYDLLGLFAGTGLAHGSPSSPHHLPNMVFLYRRPILDYWAEHEETLGAIVTHVLVHEIGHHFGLSDEDMARIELSAEAGEPGTMQ